MTAYDDLMAYERQTQALSQVAGRLGWDQETMMPEGATPQRAEEHAAMAGVTKPSFAYTKPPKLCAAASRLGQST